MSNNKQLRLLLARIQSLTDLNDTLQKEALKVYQLDGSCVEMETAEQVIEYRKECAKLLITQAQEIATLQKDNDTLNTDLKEAEGAVADLMELNDTLTAEVVEFKLQIKRLIASDDRTHKSLDWHSGKREKAEAEVEAQVGYIHKLQNENSDYLQGKKQAEAERDRLRDGMKKHTVDFFYWWYNQPGTNTDKGYDAYIETLE